MHLEYISLVAEKRECDGSEVAFGDGGTQSLKECAEGCHMLDASMFIFGTNDFGKPMCSEDKCECYCETSSKAGVCNQKDNKGFRLYKFVQKGNFQSIQVSLRLFVHQNTNYF